MLKGQAMLDFFLKIMKAVHMDEVAAGEGHLAENCQYPKSGVDSKVSQDARRSACKILTDLILQTTQSLAEE